MRAPQDLSYLHQAALNYAARGWAVFPLHTAVHDPSKPATFTTARLYCSCGQPDCAAPAKHPRTRHGVKEASADREKVDAWWTRWPMANIGIATGLISRLCVIDIDGERGMATFAAQVAQHGHPRRTDTVKTPNGWHLYYTVSPEAGVVKNSRHDGLDVRGDGGYVVAPPSMHISGQEYVWILNI